MSDMVIVALVFLLLVGGLYFGTLFITWLFGRRNLPKSPESIFLRIAKFNPDYCALYDTCSIEKDMLEWYFAFSARKTLFRGKKFELDEEMLGIPIEFICRLSRNREQEDHLPPIAGIAAASLSLKRGLLKHPLFVDRADKTMLPVHLDGADKEIWQYFANLYLDHFARRTNRQGLDESILNLSELHSLVILCSNVGLNPSDLFTTDPEGSDLIRYIHTCNRIYKGRVGVFAINNEDRDPCTCGTFFAIDTASLLNQYDFASGANDSNSRLRFDQKGVGYFLEDAYNRKAGGFGAYVQGLPTLIHTELAVRLYKFDGTNLRKCCVSCASVK